MGDEEMNPSLYQFRSIPLVRNSERASFKNCQAQWSWRWNWGLISRMPKRDARWFGSAWHLICADHYCPPNAKNGFARASVDRSHSLWDELMKDSYEKISTFPYFGEKEEQEWVDAKELGHFMIDGYWVKWQGDPTWEVLMPEQRFRVRIPFNERQSAMPVGHWTALGFTDRTWIATLVGTFDMPIRNHSYDKPRIEIVDHKTDRAYDPVLSYLVKDDQGGSYIAVGTQALRTVGLISKEEAITGMIFNFARKAKPDARPTNGLGQSLNKDGSVSKQQPAPLFYREIVTRNKANRLRQMVRIADDVEQMQMIRTGQMGITKNPGKHCGWCDFKDLCDIDEDGGDTEQFIKDVYKTEDPYSDHREDAVNSKVVSHMEGINT